MSTKKEQAGAEDQDGDFVALRARREDKISDPIIEFTDDPKPTTERPMSPVARPVSGRTRDATARLFVEAKTASKEDFERLLNDMTVKLDKVFDPEGTQKNILLYVLHLKRRDLAKVILERADANLLRMTCEVMVASLKGKKNALHYATEQFDVDLAREILNKLPSASDRMTMLKEETPVEIEGQRPRTLPCCHLAAFYGSKELVVLYLSNGIDVNAINSKKDTALLWAARWNHIDVVEELLMRNASSDIQNDKGSTALYWAVRYGHTECVSKLISKRANVNQTRKLGLVAPIILACAMGYREIVQLLVKAGADVNQKIRGEERPIHHAAREGYSDIISFLLENNAPIDVQDEAGDTALLHAARFGHARCVQLLLARGANHKHVNHTGEDLMALAVDSDNTSVLKIVLQFVKQHGETGGSRSPLLLASASGEVNKIKLLLETGLDPSDTDEEGNTMMHYAATENRHEVITQFYSKVKIDAQNKKGNTAMHNACGRGYAESIEALMSSKAQASIKNNEGETALHVAAACKQIHPDTVKKLMNYVIKSHAWEALMIKSKDGNNALHVAAKYARPEVMWEFRHISIKAKDSDGNIALHEAVRPDEPEALTMMLDIYEAVKRDADINEPNNEKETVLHLAAKEGFAEHIPRLVLLGADLSRQNIEGNNVLHILTGLSAQFPNKSKIYLEVFQAVLDQALMWWCMKHKLQYPHGDNPELAALTRAASLALLTESYNKSEKSVLAMACQVGAADIVNFILSRKNVMRYECGDNVLYNVTNMTPLTNHSLKKGCCGGGAEKSRPSYIDFLLSLDHKELACKVLDVQPFRQIEKVYSSVAAVTYVIIMSVHIIYMALLSYSGVFLLELRRTEPDNDTIYAATIFLYVIAPIEPGIILFYFLYKLTKVICRGELPEEFTLKKAAKAVKSENQFLNIVYQILPYLLGLIYCVLVILWIAFYVMKWSDMDFIFSVAVCIGWLYTLSFTRGIRIIHYFWRMIQNMIVKDILKFLFIYLFVLLAFTFALHAVFQVSQPVIDTYPNPLHTGFLVFNMMIGMADLFSDQFEADIEPYNRIVFIKVTYLVYIVLATILLLNLLIAMMNDSYSNILQQHSVTWRVESVQLGVDIEKTFPASIKLFSRIKFIQNPPEVVAVARKMSVIPGVAIPGFNNNRSSNGKVAPLTPAIRDVWCISVPIEKAGAVDRDSDETERESLRDIKFKMAAVTSDLQQMKHDLDDIRSLLRDLKPLK